MHRTFESQLMVWADDRWRLLDEVERLEAARLTAKPLPGKWSILEIVEHLVVADPGSSPRPAGPVGARGPTAPSQGSSGLSLGDVCVGLPHSREGAITPVPSSGPVLVGRPATRLGRDPAVASIVCRAARAGRAGQGGVRSSHRGSDDHAAGLRHEQAAPGDSHPADQETGDPEEALSAAWRSAL
jgi:hypothetical protein